VTFLRSIVKLVCDKDDDTRTAATDGLHFVGSVVADHRWSEG